MSDSNFIQTLSDIIRWIIGLILLPITFWIIFWSLNIPFEFIVSHTSHFYTIFYILMWIIISGIFITFCMMIGKVLPLGILFLIRQRLVFNLIFSICSLIFLGYVYYIVWSDSTMLGWELFNHMTLNRFIFSLYITIYIFSTLMNFSSVVVDDEINKNFN